MSNPLFDSLFRPTTVTPSIASAPPVRAPGVRSRAGNAMNRTRAALMTGAGRAVEVSGTKITMAQVAAAAGVAKATLYNHFRTREAVLDALLATEVDALVDQFVGLSLEEALSGAAQAISKHPLRRSLALLEPQTLAAIGRIDEGAEPWHKVHEAVSDLLGAHARGGTDFVVRWLASFLLTPAHSRDVQTDLALVVAALPVIPEPADEPTQLAD